MICLDKMCHAKVLGSPMSLTLEMVYGISGGFFVLDDLSVRDFRKVGRSVQHAALFVFCSELSFHYRYFGLKAVPLYGRVFLIGMAIESSLILGLGFGELCLGLLQEGIGVGPQREDFIRELRELVYLSSQVALLAFTILALDAVEGFLQYRRSFGELDFL